MVLLKNALFYQKKMKKRHSQGNTPICGLTYTSMKIRRVSQFVKTGQVGCWQVGSENVSALVLGIAFGFVSYPLNILLGILISCP